LKKVEVVEEGVRSHGWWSEQNLLIFWWVEDLYGRFLGGERALVRALREVGETQYSETGAQLFYPGKSGRLI
jgi:hypothetical protein